MLKCCFKGSLFYIILLLLFKAAQRMLALVSAAGRLTLGNMPVEKQEEKTQEKNKLSDSVTSNKQQPSEGTNYVNCKAALILLILSLC